MRLLQDVKDPWKHFVICMLLNRTRGAQVAKLLPGLFKRFPTAVRMAQADLTELRVMVRSLGFYNVRAQRLLELARWFADGNRVHVSGRPPGAGRYALESYQILFGKKRPRRVSDAKLRAYMKELYG